MGTLKIGSASNRAGITINPKVVLFNGNNVRYIKSGLTEIWSFITALVPKMTSNTTPSGVASATDTNTSAGLDAWKTFDNDGTTFWATIPVDLNKAVWLKYEFPQVKQVLVVNIIPHKDNNGTHLKDFIVQGSNDNNNWIDLCDTITNPNGNISTLSVVLTKNVGHYKSYRIYMLNSYTSYRAITEIQFYGTR